MFSLSSRPQRSSLSIRFESIGGMGGHSAAQIFAQAAVGGHQWRGHQFSSYGSEKKGTPVQSHIRLWDRHQADQVSSTPVINPEVLVVFHEKILATRAQSLMDCQKGSDLLVNSPHLPAWQKLPKGIQCHRIACVDATKIAAKSFSRINVVMLGALCALTPEIDRKNVREVLENFFSNTSPENRKNNIKAFEQGLKKVRTSEFLKRRTQEILPTITEEINLGHETAPIGGTLPVSANSWLKDWSVSRTGTIPQLDSEACINCGFCDMVCPDYCFIWGRDAHSNSPQLQGINYQHCKACQKCIVACPVDALSPAPETADILQIGRARYDQT